MAEGEDDGWYGQWSSVGHPRGEGVASLPKQSQVESWNGRRWSEMAQTTHQASHAETGLVRFLGVGAGGAGGDVGPVREGGPGGGGRGGGMVGGMDGVELGDRRIL